MYLTSKSEICSASKSHTKKHSRLSGHEECDSEIRHAQIGRRLDFNYDIKPLTSWLTFICVNSQKLLCKENHGYCYLTLSKLCFSNYIPDSN